MDNTTKDSLQTQFNLYFLKEKSVLSLPEDEAIRRFCRFMDAVDKDIDEALRVFDADTADLSFSHKAARQQIERLIIAGRLERACKLYMVALVCWTQKAQRKLVRGCVSVALGIAAMSLLVVSGVATGLCVGLTF